MEAEAKAFEIEKKNNPEEDDHDTRKLPKPERMRLVVKNKDVRRHSSLSKPWHLYGCCVASALGVFYSNSGICVVPACI